MAEDEQIAALRQRHAELERQLVEEQARPRPDSGTLARLKREKLALKDRIAGLGG